VDDVAATAAADERDTKTNGHTTETIELNDVGERGRQETISVHEATTDQTETDEGDLTGS